MLVKWWFGGFDLFDGISVWWCVVFVLYWYFVMYGLSELYVKELDDLVVSGFGFELMMCVVCVVGDDELLCWVFSFL